jgi:hypothetical protein
MQNGKIFALHPPLIPSTGAIKKAIILVKLQIIKQIKIYSN